jgi:hypothetical protein
MDIYPDRGGDRREPENEFARKQVPPARFSAKLKTSSVEIRV